jgi:hypothetical protein
MLSPVTTTQLTHRRVACRWHFPLPDYTSPFGFGQPGLGQVNFIFDRKIKSSIAIY